MYPLTSRYFTVISWLHGISSISLNTAVKEERKLCNEEQSMMMWIGL